MIKSSEVIVPHLWFNTEVHEAVAYYSSIFTDSTTSHTMTLNDTPSGDAPIVSFELMGKNLWRLMEDHILLSILPSHFL